MVNFFVRPSFGLWVGIGAGSKDKGENSGNGGIVLGDLLVQLGALLGGVVGIGERFGVYTGLMGALALIPLLGFGFVGVPIGIHYKQRIGLGLIFPIYVGEWWIGLVAGIAVFVLAWHFQRSD